MPKSTYLLTAKWPFCLYFYGYMRLLLFVFFSNVFCFQLSAQNAKDSIWFMNGELVLGEIIDTTLDVVTYKYNIKKKEKLLKTDGERLFSIRYGNNNKTYHYYEFDSISGNIFTVDETRYFVYGEYDAKRGYKPRLDFVGGFLVGTASALFSPSVIAPAGPIAFTLIVKIPKVKVNTKVLMDKTYLKKDTYLMGYELIARKKKTLYALTGGAIGLGVGLATAILLGQKHL